MHTWHEFQTAQHHIWRLRDGKRRPLVEIIETWRGWLVVRADGNVASKAHATVLDAIKVAI